MGTARARACRSPAAGVAHTDRDALPAVGARARARQGGPLDPHVDVLDAELERLAHRPQQRRGPGVAVLVAALAGGQPIAVAGGEVVPARRGAEPAARVLPGD